jgi:glycosyltransferase involved in cell wall biosynthesis
MRERTDILLVAPYDRYPSIQRFVACLERQLSSRASIRVFQPRPILARFSSGAARKWLGYFDKFVLVPRSLAREAEYSGLVHLTDQSLAIYARGLGPKPRLINCHDLIAIRAALGEFPEFRAGRLGRQLQKGILHGLSQARHVVCLAECTKNDLQRLTGMPSRDISVIPMGLHSEFRRMQRSEAKRTTTRFIPEAPFLLHVGGNQWYKNRQGLLAIYARLVRLDATAPNLVLLGEALTAKLKAYIQEQRLEQRVFSVTGASDADLMAFYSQASALLFPSLCEGFGWPVVEAQACGCPVITTDRQPMTDVAGSAAVCLPAGSTAHAAERISEFLCECPEKLAERIRAGHGNVARFSTRRMIDSYLALYSQLTAGNSALPILEPAFA